MCGIQIGNLPRKAVNVGIVSIDIKQIDTCQLCYCLRVSCADRKMGNKRLRNLNERDYPTLLLMCMESGPRPHVDILEGNKSLIIIHDQ